MIRTLCYLALLLWITAVMARQVRDRCMREPALRGKLRGLAAVMFIVCVAGALWWKGAVPETPGSPATIVLLLLGWGVFGMGAYAALVALIGTVLPTAHP